MLPAMQAVPQDVSARILREARAQQEELDAEEAAGQQQAAAAAQARRGQGWLSSLGFRAWAQDVIQLQQCRRGSRAAVLFFDFTAWYMVLQGVNP